jgi:hypothetical protein
VTRGSSPSPVCATGLHGLPLNSHDLRPGLFSNSAAIFIESHVPCIVNFVFWVSMVAVERFHFFLFSLQIRSMLVNDFHVDIERSIR